MYDRALLEELRQLDQHRQASELSGKPLSSSRLIDAEQRTVCALIELASEKELYDLVEVARDYRHALERYQFAEEGKQRALDRLARVQGESDVLVELDRKEQQHGTNEQSPKTPSS